MANIKGLKGFTVARSMAAGPLPTLTMGVRDNVGLNAGDAVILQPHTGLIDIALATSPAIFGVVQEDVTAGTGNKALVIPAMPDLVFEGHCSGNPTSYMGDLVDIEGASGSMEINENSSSYGVVRIIGVQGSLDNAQGAAARVLFTFAKSQWTGTIPGAVAESQNQTFVFAVAGANTSGGADLTVTGVAATDDIVSVTGVSISSSNLVVTNLTSSFSSTPKTNAITAGGSPVNTLNHLVIVVVSRTVTS